jgi:glycosyltransferase involved in cell wall biosynthesis
MRRALGCGRPVLTTDKVNICDRIAGCKAGLVETDSAEGVKTLIEKWFSLTENDRKIMRENAEVCFDEFDVKCAAQNLIEVLGTYGIK